MKRSRQNLIPSEFKSFYTPQLTLKKLLQSGSSHIDENHNEEVVIDFCAIGVDVVNSMREYSKASRALLDISVT